MTWRTTSLQWPKFTRENCGERTGREWFLLGRKEKTASSHSFFRAQLLHSGSRHLLYTFNEYHLAFLLTFCPAFLHCEHLKSERVTHDPHTWPHLSYIYLIPCTSPIAHIQALVVEEFRRSPSRGEGGRDAVTSLFMSTSTRHVRSSSWKPLATSPHDPLPTSPPHSEKIAQDYFSTSHAP